MVLECKIKSTKIQTLSTTMTFSPKLIVWLYSNNPQMNYEGDNPPIGIVLCADKSDSIVKFTLPENET